MLIEKVKNHSKDYLKSLYGWSMPSGLRFGKIFREYLKLIAESQFWSYEQLRDYQNFHLSKLVEHAYEYTPYYRELFIRAGITPDDINTVDDLPKIPFLTKHDMKNNLELMRSRAFKEKDLEIGYTGGSTGIPVSFYREKKKSSNIERAFSFRARNWAGVNYRDKLATFSGGVIVNGRRELWYENIIDKKIDFSSDDLTIENLKIIVDKIIEYKPVVIYGYPSAISQLSKFIKDFRIDKIKPKAIFTASETLYPSQRNFFEKVFGCKVFDSYGHSERAVLASECERHEGYHVFMEYGILEILDKDNKAVDKEGAVGEVIATGLHNYSMPIIRFKTSDNACYTSKKCSCMRNYPLIKSFDGRLQELILSKSGRKISMTSINFHSNIFDNVRQFQFHQYEKGRVDLHIIKLSGYRKEDSENIIQNINKKVGHDLDITIKFVNEIPTTKRGKRRFLIQNLEI